MENKERTLPLTAIVKEYLLVNHWTISDMSDILRIPRTTLSDWLNGNTDRLASKYLAKVKDFLGGKYYNSVELVINNMLIKMDLEEESEDEFSIE